MFYKTKLLLWCLFVSLVSPTSHTEITARSFSVFCRHSDLPHVERKNSKTSNKQRHCLEVQKCVLSFWQVSRLRVLPVSLSSQPGLNDLKAVITILVWGGLATNVRPHSNCRLAINNIYWQKHGITFKINSWA